VAGCGGSKEAGAKLGGILSVVFPII